MSKPIPVSFFKKTFCIGCLLGLVLPGMAGGEGFVLVRIAGGLDHPVYVTQAPNDPRHIYILERYEGKPGQTVGQRDAPFLARVKKVDLTTLAVTTWLELEGIITVGDGGMHCMAFHPDFATNGKVYLTGEIADPTGSGVTAASFLDEYVVTDDEPAFNRRLLVIPQRAGSNGWHATDWIGFKPGATGSEKSYLYITQGDGGIQACQSGFENVSQDLSSLYGKMLRIDVDDPNDYYPNDPFRNYAIPSSNPFFEDADNDGIDDDPTTAPEVFHYGLRNPWRASFDRATGDIYIGDVGRNAREEVSFAKAGSGPIDFGWARREGMTQTVCETGGEQGDSINPIYDYGGSGKAVMAGYVYRGPVAELQGLFFFADHIQDKLYTASFDRDTDPATFNGANLTNVQDRWNELEGLIVGGGQMYNIVSFGEDLAGNLYFTNLGVGGQRQGDPAFDTGQVFRIVPTPPYCNVRSLGDMSGDCLVTLLDLALIEPTVEALLVLAEDWLSCGLDPVTACP